MYVYNSTYKEINSEDMHPERRAFVLCALCCALRLYSFVKSYSFRVRDFLLEIFYTTQNF